MSFDSSRVSRVFRSSFPRAEDTGFRTQAWRAGAGAVPVDSEPLYRTALHAFAFAAKQDDRTGIKLLSDDPAGASHHCSYRELYHRAASMAVALRGLRVAPGERVLIVLPTSHDFVVSLFAVQLLGAIPVPSYPPATLARAPQAIERLRRIADTSGAVLCLTDRKLLPLLGEIASSKQLREVVTCESLRGDGSALGGVRVSSDESALIQYTSGSTNQPRGVLLSHGNLVANMHVIGQALQINRGDSVVSWLPLYHDMGLIGGLLFSVYWRIPLTLMSPMAFMADPLRWLRVLSDDRATLSPAPNFAYALACKRARSQPVDHLDLSNWRIALSGAEPVNPATVEEFTRTFAVCGFRAEAMQPVYGLAECSLAAAFPEPSQRPRYLSVDRQQLAAGHAQPAQGAKAMGLTSVGGAMPGHTLAVTDECGRILAEREVGHVIVSGPSVMQGYFSDPEASAAVLRGDALWTGDLGFFDEGELFVVGRAKDLIIVRGRNYYAEDLERTVSAVPGTRPGGVVAFAVYDEKSATDLVVFVCEVSIVERTERLARVQKISAAVACDFGIAVDEVVLARPGTIPKTPSGKPQRGRCRDLYLSGELGRGRSGKVGAAITFARSGAGFLAATTRRLLRRRAPD